MSAGAGKDGRREKRHQALVLDLRNNPGGLLTQAVRVADLFLDSGLIVYTEGRIESQNKSIARKRKDRGWTFR
jgi:carboxyl-terminal processing protease